jgi:hypothetical protein
MGGRRQGATAPLEKAIQAAVVGHWRLLGEPDASVTAIQGIDLPGGFPVGFIELKHDRDADVGGAQLDFGRLCARLELRYVIAVGRDEPICILRDCGVVRRAAA